MTYPTYPEYKDSGVEWLGEVPAHWKISRLKFFGKLITGFTPPSEDLSNYTEAGWPWIRPDDLNDQSQPVQASKFLTDQGWIYCRPVSSGSTLVCSIGSIGKLGYTEKLACTNQQITAIQPYYDARFLFYLVYASKPELDLRATGNVLRILNAERLGNVPAVMPPVDESSYIATFLDHETARIDALVEEQQHLIALLKEKRQAVISHAVTKGLNPDVPKKGTGVEWLGEVPEHWEVIGSKRFLRLVAEPAPKNNNFELLSVYTDIGVRPRKELEAKGNKASTTDGYWLVKKGDIIVNKLLAWMGAVGFSAYEGVTSPAYDILRPIRDMDSKFYHYLFRSKRAQQEFKRWSRGIMDMRLRLYFDELGRILVPFPPPEEQTRIVQYIENIENKYDELISAASEQIKLLSERRSALISAAVTGKIDVRGLQPPAVSAVATGEAKQMEAV